jgi:4-oxalocrotonate tautomerase family enzyme
VPKIIIHAPDTAFNAEARQAIAAGLTDFALECEALPRSPLLRSSVWTYFNEYRADHVFFMGGEPATAKVVSVQVFVIEGGLDNEAKKKLIQGATAIFARHLGAAGRIPVYIVIHEVPETNWGIFGKNADLAALRASPVDAPAL